MYLFYPELNNIIDKLVKEFDKTSYYFVCLQKKYNIFVLEAMKKSFTIFVLFLFAFSLNAQVKIKVCNNTDFTPTDLILNEFLGDGVEVLDVKYTGEYISSGKFSNIGDVIGIDKGILLTTGEAAMASFPNSTSKQSSYSSGLGDDQDLRKAAETSEPLYDICEFEITFRPFSDSLSFRYVFASNEYPEFSCDSFNDVFGFFISGQNPSGGFYDYENIALIPETNLAVSIKNIHPEYNEGGKPYCTPIHDEYYTPLAPESAYKMFYDGYINIFTAEAKVVPCETYKIKIAIADVKDKSHDSAVFLEAKSFSTNVLKTDLITASHDSTIAEGCTDASLIFNFDNPISDKYDLHLRLLTNSSISNLATYDIDYTTNLNTTSSIKKGQQSAIINFTALDDNIIENQEIIALEYQKDLCNKDTIYIKISDNDLANIIITDSLTVCQGDTVNINAQLSSDSNSSKDKYFRNNKNYTIPKELNGTINSPITVSGIFPDDIQLWKLKEICIDTLIATVLTDLDIYLISPLPDTIKLELSTDNGYKNGDLEDVDTMINTCFTPTATKPINNGNYVQGAFDPLNPTFTGQFKPEGYFDDLTGKKANGFWNLQIVNDEEGFVSELKSWHIAFKSNYTIDYNWTPSYNISCNNCLSPDIYPQKDTFYKISLTDSYGCSSSDSLRAVIKKLKTIPFVDCDSISTDFIRIKWGINTPGETYEIKVNNGEWKEITKNNFSQSGLGFLETINFEIRIKSDDCINTSFFHQCTTYPCPAPTIDIVSVVDNKCFSDANGEIKLEASGTKAPYSFKYHNQVNNTGYFNNLPTGTDTIFITDGDACSIPFVFTISSPNQIGADFTIEKIKCHNEKNGTITANGFGGKGDLKYKWLEKSNNKVYTSKSISNLKNGLYYITITDDNACSYIDSITLDNPSRIVVKDSIVNIVCKGENTGEIRLKTYGGTPPYVYHWNTPLGNSTIKDLTGIPSGQYFLTVTDDNNCQVIKSYSITEPADGLDINYNIKDSLCYGESNGSIELLLPPNNNYQVTWSNGATGTFQDNLAEGHYEVTITDNNIGCQKIISEDIIQLDSLTMILEQSNASCHDYEDGSAWVSKVFYGARETDSSLMNFAWSSNPTQYGQYAYNLKGGKTYFAIATNSFGCTAKKSITIGNPQEIKIKVTDKKDVSCYGYNDGLIEVENTGGNNDYTYNWSANANTNNKPYAHKLKSGIYKLTVTDLKGCKQEALYYIKEPDPISINFNNSAVSCFKGSDGKSKPLINGGSAPYFITWNKDINQDVLKDVKAGKYFILVRDINGCEKNDSTVITEPKDSVFSIVESFDTKCNNGFDGQLIFSTTGGTPPYSNKVIGDKYYSGSKIIGLKKGTYISVTKDVNGCTDTIKNIIISEPNPISIDLGNDTIVDYGDKLTLTPEIKNAIPPFTYNWTVPSGVNIRCVDCYSPEIEVLFNFIAKLEITDSLNCSGIGDKYIAVKVNNDIFVPDAFRPNSNVISNKHLFVYGKDGITVLSFKVYNSLGGKVYQRDNFMVNDESLGWDGTFKGVALNAASFIWTLKTKNKAGKFQNYKGIVTLIR